MARIIFPTQPGVARRLILPEQGTIPGSVELRTGSSLLRSGLAIFTGVRGREAVKHQLQVTLGRDIYLYAFGDKPGQLTVSGLGFTANAIGGCGPGDLNHNDEAGIDVIHRYYNRFKASRLDVDDGSSTPSVRIRIGTQVHRGILIGMQYAIDDPSTMLAKFSLTFTTLPEV